MYKKLDILDEKDERLRKVSVDAKLPLTKEYKKIIKNIITELTYSQIEEYEKTPAGQVWRALWENLSLSSAGLE